MSEKVEGDKLTHDAARGAGIVSKQLGEDQPTTKRRVARAVAYALWYRDERLK